MRKTAAARGWEIVAEYTDNDVSATKDRRDGTGWSQMLAAIRAGQANMILCTEPPRLMRTLPDFVILSKVLRARLVAVRSGLDSGTVGGALAWGQLVLIAEHEIAQKEERRIPYVRTRHAAGHPSPGMPPFGYRWVPSIERKAKKDETRWVVDPDEEKQVRWFFDEAVAVQNPSLATMCRDAEAKGWRTRSGAPWRPSTLRRVLMNPAYAALLPPLRVVDPDAPDDEPRAAERAGSEYVDIDECTAGAWEPIATEAEVRALRRVLTSPSRRKNRGEVARKWLLSGLALCAVCVDEGHPDAALRSGVERRGRRVYKCKRLHLSRLAEPIDALIKYCVVWRLSQADAASLLTPRDESKAVALTAQRRDLEDRVQRLHDMREADALTMPEYLERLEKVRADLVAVVAALDEEHAASPLVGIAGVHPSEVEARWTSLTLPRQRAVIAALLDVTVERVGPGRRFGTMEALAPTVPVQWREELADVAAQAALWERAQAEGVSEEDYQNAVNALPQTGLSGALGVALAAALAEAP